MFFSNVTLFITYSACSNLIPLHPVNIHALNTCDRPLVTANNDLCDIKEVSMFGKLELLYSNGLCSAGCQLLFNVVYSKPAQVLPLVYIAGAADESTHMHRGCYAADDNREWLWLCTDLQITENLSVSKELDAGP